MTGPLRDALHAAPSGMPARLTNYHRSRDHNLILGPNGDTARRLSALTQVMNLTRRRAAQVRAFVRFLAAISALAAAIVYLHFGSLSPCGVLREAARERGGLAAILPDDMVDLGIAGQYGPMSPGRCLAVLMDNLGAPIAISAPSSQQRMAPMPQTTPWSPAERSSMAHR